MVTKENCCNKKTTFWSFVGLSQFWGVLAIVLLVVWNCVYNGGFLWDGRNREFAIHPICMILSLFLFGEGCLIYRVCSCFSRPVVKWIHVILLTFSVCLSIFGVVTVFVYHASMHYGNMYTMHSWLGMATLVGLIAQLFAGCAILIFPWKDSSVRSTYLPIHRYGSFALLTMLAASALTGVLDDIFLCMSNKKYQTLNPHAVMFNVVGLTSLGFVLTVMYLLYRDDWKRGNRLIKSDAESSDAPSPNPTEEQPLLKQSSKCSEP